MNSQLTLFQSPERPALPDTVEQVLEGLTEEQREAVEHRHGPLLIVAGAGTGKTTVVTRRIACLIASGTAHPSEILALTFTDKAAAEMQERVDTLLPYGYADIQISTFHSFGDRILKRHALELGIDPAFKVLSSPEQVLFLRDHLFDLPLDRYRPPANPTGHLSALVGHFGKAKDEDRSPEEYLAWAQALVEEARGNPELEDRAAAHRELGLCYQAYRDLMRDKGFLDFGDQVYLVLELFRRRPAVLNKLQQRYRFILVDEFQDTNYSQFALVRLLAGASRNLTVVGDDDQSIYQFRGASLANILEFTERYPEARQVVLRRNFRSPQGVLDAAYRGIQHNNPDRLEIKNGIDKRLMAQKQEDSADSIEYRSFDTVSSEADAVADQIAAWVEQERYRYSDVAVLVRVNRDADPYLRAFNMKGIPYRFTGNRGLYSRPEIRLVISFLRSVCDPTDSVSLFNLASSPVYTFPRLSLVLLSSYANRNNLSLRAAFERHADPLAEDRLQLDDDSLAAVSQILEDLERYLDLLAEESPGRLLYRFITETGWLTSLSSGQLEEGEIAIQNLARFFEIVKDFEILFPGSQLPEFVRHLDLLIEAGDSPAVVEADAGAEAVEVLTVHKSKGLEFPVVFLVGLSEGKFPTRERHEAIEFPSELLRDPGTPGEERHVQEERRLFYVALTRAKERLWLSSALDTGGRRGQKVSRFVLEALDRPRIDSSVIRASSLESLHRFAPAPHQDEGWAPMAPQRVLTVSFRKLDDYLTCPLKYKYVQVLRVPILPHHSVIYGNALHSALSAYLEKRLEGETPDLAFLQERFRKAWSSQGFLTREHEEQRHSAGLDALEAFHARERQAHLPAFVEKEFAFMLGRTKVIGRWDRVDRLGDRVVLVDYKSAPVQSQEQADARARESLQLSIYAMAYERTFGHLPDEVQLHFLESGLVGSAPVERRRLKETEGTIRKAATGIRNRDYTPRPSYQACSTCAYREICPRTAS